jgi:hypothetical protein
VRAAPRPRTLRSAAPRIASRRSARRSVAPRASQVAAPLAQRIASRHSARSTAPLHGSTRRTAPLHGSTRRTSHARNRARIGASKNWEQGRQFLHLRISFCALLAKTAARCTKQVVLGDSDCNAGGECIDAGQRTELHCNGRRSANNTLTRERIGASESWE